MITKPFNYQSIFVAHREYHSWRGIWEEDYYVPYEDVQDIWHSIYFCARLHKVDLPSLMANL